MLWVSTSIVLEWTVTAFGSFSQLYGSLRAMIGFMSWISIVLVLFGAEINAEARRRGGITLGRHLRK